MQCAGGVPVRFRILRQAFGRFSDAFVQTTTGGVEPVHERGCARHDQPLQEFSSVQRIRGCVIAAVERVGDGVQVRPAVGRIDKHTGALIRNSGGAKDASQHLERLAESCPCLGLVGIWPEQRQDLVALSYPNRACPNQPCEQRQSLRTSQQRRR
jgi:hypothetical protein